MRIVERILLPALNHILSRENWARERLHAHSGARVRINGGPFDINLCIDARGMFDAINDSSEPDVTLLLPGDLPLKLLVDRENLFSSIKLSGSVELAETLGFVFRNLDWDVEAELANLIGDIAAHRVVLGGKSLAKAFHQGFRRTRENFSEYLAEENGLLPAQGAIREFSDNVSALREDLARLEKRALKLN